MRVREAPTEREIQTRARAATETLFCRFPYRQHWPIGERKTMRVAGGTK